MAQLKHFGRRLRYYNETVVNIINKYNADSDKLNRYERQYINEIVVELQDSGLWNKLQTIYLFLLGTPNSCKWNIKDMRLVNNAYPIRYEGTHVFNRKLGVKNSSGNSKLYTNLYTNAELVIDDLSFGYSLSTNNLVTHSSSVFAGFNLGTGASRCYAAIFNEGGNMRLVSNTSSTVKLGTLSMIGAAGVYSPIIKGSYAMSSLNGNSYGIENIKRITVGSVSSGASNFSTKIEFTFLNMGNGNQGDTNNYMESAWIGKGLTLQETIKIQDIFARANQLRELF